MKIIHGRPHYGWMADDHDDYDEDRVSRDDRSTMAWILGGLVALALLCVAFGVANAQTALGFCGFPKVMTPPSTWIASGAATQQIVVSTTAQSLTVPAMRTGGPVVGARVQVLLGLVKERHDGTAAVGTSNTVGSVWGPGGTSVSGTPPFYDVCGSDMSKLSLIQYSASATASTVNVYYYIPGQ